MRPEVAVVLAGGKSRRLGQDKAALLHEGQPLLARMVDLARQVCPFVAVSGRDPAPFGIDAPWFADDEPGLGPLGGIATALARYKTACLALSCDLPRLDKPTLDRLLAAWRVRPAHAVMTTFQQAETGFIEALVAVYQPEAELLLRRASASGMRKLSGAIPQRLRHVVVYHAWENRPFFNLNTPAELLELRQPQERRAPAV